MDTQLDISKLSNLIVKRLKPLKPIKIILFGSYAYGNPSKDSDLDICVIQTNENSKVQVRKDIRNRLKDIIIAKDILVPTLQEYDFYKLQYGSVFMDIDQKGKVLWVNS
ncbi:MAG: nucleotidyltransferase domain-containing protein [Salinivirgaceae bacterium]